MKINFTCSWLGRWTRVHANIFCLILVLERLDNVFSRFPKACTGVSRSKWLNCGMSASVSGFFSDFFLSEFSKYSLHSARAIPSFAIFVTDVFGRHMLEPHITTSERFLYVSVSRA